MPATLRSFLSLLFVCLSVGAWAQAPCRRGFAVPEPFVVNSDFRLRSTFSDLDGDRRPDTILQGDAEDYVFLNRGDVHPLVSVSGHVAGESLVAVHDQNGDGKGDFIYKEASSWLVALGNGDGTGGTIVQSFPGPVAGYPVPTDVDRDGRLDFLAIGEKELQFLRGTGDGRFAAAGTFPIQRPSDRRPPVTGDFDGDGSLDVATFADATPLILKMVRIFWTSSSFAVTGPSMNQAPMPETLVAADVEGDGAAEIIGFLDGRLVVIRGTDRIVKIETVELPPDAGSGSLTAVGITDFDGDGRRDLIAAGGSGSVLVFRGTANGTWRSADLYAMGDGGCPRILDLDADGRDDVVSGCGALGVLYGGRPSSALPGFRTAGTPRDVAVTDQNRDGIADLVVTTDTGIELMLGAANGTFSATSWSTAGHAAAITDLDEDAVPDLVVSVGETNKVFFGTANGFSADFATLPGGQVLGAWTIEGKSVVVMRDGLALQTVAFSPGHDTTLTPLPPLPGQGPATLIEADGDPDFELIYRSFQDFPRVWQRSGDEWTPGESVGDAGDGAVSGDLNGDGRPDLVLWGSHFSVYLSHGSSYRAAAVVPFGNVLDHGRAHSAAIADFDKDGRNDVVLTSDSAFSVLRNLGDGTFEPYAVSPGGMKGGRLLDADGDGWLDAIGLGDEGVHVVRNVCAPPRVRLTVLPSAPREGESATIHLQSLALFPYGFDIMHNGVWMHGGSEKFQTLSWTTPPLPAGRHTFTGQVLDRLAPAEAAEKKIYVDPPGGRRRTVRQ